MSSAPDFTNGLFLNRKAASSEVDMLKIGLSLLGILAVGIMVIFVTGGVPLGRNGAGSLSKIQAVGLPEYKIEVVGPAETTFSSLMAKELHKATGANLEALKSSSVFVVNHSEQAIAALNVKWELVQADGRSIIHHQAYSSGLQVMSGAGVAHFKEETASNSQRMVSLLDVSNSPNRGLRVNMGGGGVDKARQLSESVKVRVSVDGVLFVDGTFVGPDTRNYFDSLKAEIEARNEMFEEITRALNGDAEAMKRIEALARGDREAIQRFGGKEHAGGQLEMKRLAGATLAIRKDLGDKAVLERINAELSKPRITLRKL